MLAQGPYGMQFDPVTGQPVFPDAAPADPFALDGQGPAMPAMPPGMAEYLGQTQAAPPMSATPYVPPTPAPVAPVAPGAVAAPPVPATAPEPAPAPVAAKKAPAQVADDEVPAELVDSQGAVIPWGAEAQAEMMADVNKRVEIELKRDGNVYTDADGISFSVDIPEGSTHAEAAQILEDAAIESGLPIADKITVDGKVVADNTAAEGRVFPDKGAVVPADYAEQIAQQISAAAPKEQLGAQDRATFKESVKAQLAGDSETEPLLTNAEVFALEHPGQFPEAEQSAMDKYNAPHPDFTDPDGTFSMTRGEVALADSMRSDPRAREARGKKLAIAKARRDDVTARDVIAAQKAAAELARAHEVDTVRTAKAVAKVEAEFAPRLREQSERIRKQTVDPRNLFASQSTLANIITGLSIFIGGMKQKENGGRNYALETVFKLIDNDMAAQKSNMANAIDSYGIMEREKSEALASPTRIEAANAAVGVAKLNAIEAEVKARFAQIENPDVKQRVQDVLDAFSIQRETMIAAAQDQAKKDMLQANDERRKERESQADVTKKNVSAAAEAKKAGLTVNADGSITPRVSSRGRGGGGLPKNPDNVTVKEITKQMGVRENQYDQIILLDPNASGKDLTYNGGKAVVAKSTAVSQTVGLRVNMFHLLNEQMSNLQAIAQDGNWTDTIKVANLTTEDRAAWDQAQGWVVQALKYMLDLGAMTPSEYDAAAKLAGGKATIQWGTIRKQLVKAGRAAEGLVNRDVAQASPGQKFDPLKFIEVRTGEAAGSFAKLKNTDAAKERYQSTYNRAKAGANLDTKADALMELHGLLGQYSPSDAGRGPDVGPVGSVSVRALDGQIKKYTSPDKLFNSVDAQVDEYDGLLANAREGKAAVNLKPGKKGGVTARDKLFDAAWFQRLLRNDNAETKWGRAARAYADKHGFNYDKFAAVRDYPASPKDTEEMAAVKAAADAAQEKASRLMSVRER